MPPPTTVEPEQHAILKHHLADLQDRHALAKRRLAAHTAHLSNGDPPNILYLGTPDAILAMRQRLASAVDDEAQVQKLAEELRGVKERLTEQALAFYANKCDKEGFGGQG